MTTKITFFSSDAEEMLVDAFKIRRKVFIAEQKVAQDLEIDGKDTEALHFIIYLNDEPVGTCRVRNTRDNSWKLERFAIIKEYRKSGLGRKLLSFVEKTAVRSGVEKLIFNAQISAKGFYNSQGYKEIDKEIFYEAGIAHLKMEKILL